MNFDKKSVLIGHIVMTILAIVLMFIAFVGVEKQNRERRELEAKVEMYHNFMNDVIDNYDDSFTVYVSTQGINLDNKTDEEKMQIWLDWLKFDKNFNAKIYDEFIEYLWKNNIQFDVNDEYQIRNLMEDFFAQINWEEFNETDKN